MAQNKVCLKCEEKIMVGLMFTNITVVNNTEM
jgi:hypothetical protein